MVPAVHTKEGWGEKPDGIYLSGHFVVDGILLTMALVNLPPSPTPLSAKSYGTGLNLVLFQNETRATEPAENSLGLILAQLLPHHGSLPLLALNKAGPVHFVLALWFPFAVTPSQSCHLGPTSGVGAGPLQRGPLRVAVREVGASPSSSYPLPPSSSFLSPLSVCDQLLPGSLPQMAFWGSELCPLSGGTWFFDIKQSCEICPAHSAC